MLKSWSASIAHPTIDIKYMRFMENFDPKGFVHLKYHNEVTIKHIVLHMGSSLIYWQPK